MTEFHVALFYSTSLAIHAEQVARAAGIDVKLIPTPRHLSSDCGTALRFKSIDEQRVTAALDEKRVEYDRIAPL